jgi:hypothetical protein
MRPRNIFVNGRGSWFVPRWVSNADIFRSRRERIVDGVGRTVWRCENGAFDEALYAVAAAGSDGHIATTWVGGLLGGRHSSVVGVDNSKPALPELF